MTHASVHADAKPGSLNHSCFPCTCLSVGAIAALAEKQKALCLQFAHRWFIFLALPRAPNAQVVPPPLFLTCALACYELRHEVTDDPS